MNRKRIVAVVVFLLAALALAVWWSARDARRYRDLTHCISNMRHIDAAKEQYAMAHNLTNGTVVTREQISEYIKGGWQHFDCFPAGGDRYDIGTIGEDPACPIHGSMSHVHFPDGRKP